MRDQAGAQGFAVHPARGEAHAGVAREIRGVLHEVHEADQPGVPEPAEPRPLLEPIPRGPRAGPSSLHDDSAPADPVLREPDTDPLGPQHADGDEAVRRRGHRRDGSPASVVLGRQRAQNVVIETTSTGDARGRTAPAS